MENPSERFLPGTAEPRWDAQKRLGDVSFEIQRESSHTQRVAEKRMNENKWRWGLAVSSGIIALGLLGFLLLEIFSKVNLGVSELLLVGGVCVAILIPFYDRIKFYGIELQRLIRPNGRDS